MHTLPLNRTSYHREASLALAGFAFPVSSVFACTCTGTGNDEHEVLPRIIDRFDLPSFTMALACIVGMIVVLTIVACVVRKKLAPQHAPLSPLIVATGLTACALGWVDIVVVHIFEALLTSFGYDLPTSTLAVFSYSHFLWLPALLIVGLWHVSKTWKYRKRYVAAALLVELFVLFSALLFLYVPTFDFGVVV